MMFLLSSYSSIFLQLSAVLAAAISPCSSNFMPNLTLFGASVESITTSLVTNYSEPRNFISSLSFCNVSIIYTHPGHDDHINVQVWLPSSSSYNQRLQGIGGGAFVAGLSETATSYTMAKAVYNGYAAVGTDSGHNGTATTASWALLSPGNVNLYLLEDFASISLNDASVFGKQVTEAFYGEEIKFSYWNGCSTGGRQGLVLAQRYPQAYDGILAQSPAINWSPMTMAQAWIQHVMDELNYFPSPCELNALTSAAIEACDGLDGLVDGIISAPGLCQFDPSSVVGRQYSCTGGINGTAGQITQMGAEVAARAWQGPRSVNGEFQWFGLTLDAPFSAALGVTTCGASGTNCTGTLFSVSTDWITDFLVKNTEYDVAKISPAEWDALLHQSVQEYWSIIESADPDLSSFRNAGGKMITWHGMADGNIMFNGTVNYFERVLRKDESARDFYRFFMAPGVQHCGNGPGAAPTDPLDQLIAWVEQGEAPETLPGNHTVNGMIWERNLCQYPMTSWYVGGDPASAESYKCGQ